MAWKKTFVNPDTGVSAEFWDIIVINYDKQKQWTRIEYGLWVNEQTHADGKEPILAKILEFPAGEAAQLSAGADAFGMAKVMALAEFEGAEVV